MFRIKMKQNFITFILLILIVLASCQKKLNIVTSDSVKAKDLYYQGNEQTQKLNYSKALEFYEKAVEEDSLFAMAYLKIYESRYSLRLLNNIEHYISRALEFSENASETEKLIIKFYYFSHHNNFEATKKYLKQLSDNHSHHFEVKIILAGQAWRNLEYTKAREMYQEILRQAPNYINALNNIGYIYANEGYFKEAIKYIQKYQKAAPDQLNPYDSLADIYLYLGKYNNAITILEQIIKTHSKQIENNDYMGIVIYTRLSTAYSKLGMYKKALKILDKAEKLFPHINQTKIISQYRFTLYEQLEKPEKMKLEYQKFKSFITKILSHYYESRIYLQEEDFFNGMASIDSLYSYSEKIISSAPKREFLAQTTYLDGKFDFASGMFKVAREKFNNAAATIYNALYAPRYQIMEYISAGEAGDYSTAIEGLNKILTINPNNAKAIYYVSKFYYQNKQYIEAETSLDIFFSIWKNADNDLKLIKQAKVLKQKLIRVQNS